MCEHLGLFSNKLDNNALIILALLYVSNININMAISEKYGMLCQKLSVLWKTTELRIMGMLV